MPTLAAISRERHANQRWQRFVSYEFARQSVLVPLVAAETPKASMAMPLAFIPQNDSYVPAALMGLEPGRNLLVAPDGRWLGRYVPSALRGYPFSLAKTEDETLVLCIDEDSGLLSDGPDGEPFFNDEGAPAEGLAQVMDFLQQIERNRGATAIACAALAEHDLIRPWPITLKGETGERQVEGIFQIDEAALNQLSDETFLRLRHAGALPLVYCQLLSMQHLPMLGELASAHARAPAPPPPSFGGFSLVQQEDVLKFD